MYLHQLVYPFDTQKSSTFSLMSHPIAVGDAEAVPDGREADAAGGHVRRELLLAEGGAAQQARDRGARVARDAPQPGRHLQEREGARPRRALHQLHPCLHRHQAGTKFSGH